MPMADRRSYEIVCSSCMIAPIPVQYNLCCDKYAVGLTQFHSMAICLYRPSIRTVVSGVVVVVVGVVCNRSQMRTTKRTSLIFGASIDLHHS